MPPAQAIAVTLQQFTQEHPGWACLYWLRDADDRISLQAEQGLSTFITGSKLDVDAQHQQRIARILQDGEPLTEDRRTNSNGLLPHIAFAAGLRRAGAVVGVVELLAPASVDPNHSGGRPAVEQLADRISRLLHQDDSLPPPTAAFWEELDRFLFEIHRTLNLEDVALTAANDGRRLLGCDRLSVAVVRGQETRIAAISGQDEVQRRANLVRSMRRLTERTLRGGTPLRYEGELQHLPDELHQALADYLVESRMRLVWVLPLHAPGPVDDLRAEHDPQRKQRRAIGALIVEQSSVSQPQPGLAAKSELLGDHVATALTNAQAHEAIFLLPLWRSLGRLLTWMHGRRLWWTAAGLLLLTIAGGLLTWLPWDYRVEAEGLAMPVEKYDVFAPWDGDVLELTVVSGERVRVGQILLTLRSDELQTQRLTVENEVREKHKQVSALTSQFQEADRRGAAADAVRLQGELVQARIELAGAEQELQLLEERLEKLIVKAPAAGVVATFQLRQQLQNRPVQRGERLLQVMNDQGPWQLELEVPEYRMGHILSALRRSAAESLPVEYVPSTAVEHAYAATLTEIATRSNSSAESGTIVEAYASINPDDLPHRRIGAEVTAKISCGEHSLGYVLFGDLLEFFRRKLWW
ncbi:MAG: HlyD family efflux transporter periplasmic adaptor subunit [Planctomycetaceae bacterium]|nr:HlyD family efflux transporter periplasmic adaptor subunit [Planctomycetaceae bacterium]